MRDGHDRELPPGGEAGVRSGREDSSLVDASPQFRARSAARQVKHMTGQPRPPDTEERASASHSRTRCHSERVTQGAGSTRVSGVAVLTIAWRAWTASPVGLRFSQNGGSQGLVRGMTRP